ncbi:MAG: hypothetical protein J2O38_05955, partial [Acidimicrobiales bacterium]|nr:hypothetical protein [Acidimicrobiales bacterium]
AGRDGGGMLDAGLTATTIAASTFSGNTASAFGGGIATGVHSTLSLTNSTMSGNEASLGGGLYTQGTSTITSSTISGNTAGTSGGGIDNTFAAAAVTLGASIVATNTGGNCAGLANTSVGYNLTDDATGEACGFNTSTDVVDSNPSLGPLESNGGPTETMLPAEFSTAVGRIPVPTTLDQVAVCGNGASDQRGVQRPEPPVIACTIGATEVATPVVVAAVGTDGAMWVQAPLLTPGWSSLGGQLTAAPAVAAVPQANGPASPLFIATGTDHALWVRSLSRGWTELAPDVFTFCIDSPGAVVAGSRAGLQLTVACQGGDHHLYAATVPVSLDGSLPSVAAWTNLGGALGAGPAVASVGGESVYLVTASFNNGQVWARSDTTDWQPTDFFCIGHPALAVSPIGRTTWFACQGTDRQLWAGPLDNVIPRGGAIAPGPGLGLIPGTDFMFAEARFGARSVWYLTPGAPDWLSLGGSVSESSGGVGAVGLIGPLA